MSTSTEEGRNTESKTRTGKVIAVCYSQELVNKVRKEVKDEAHVTAWGIPGDRHYGETRYSSSARKVVTNDRPVTVAGYEAGRDACERLGIPEIPAGGLGENFLIEGLGDLSDLEEGDRLEFTGAADSGGSPEVVLLVRKQNEPCSNLMIYHKQMPKQLFGKRGVICTVLKEGRVRTDDAVRLVRK